MQDSATSWVGRRVLVMGLGRFGGGVGVARYLADRGAAVTVTDLADANDLRDSVAALGDRSIELRLTEHRVEDFTSADIIVVNPAVDPRPGKNEYVEAARQAGVPFTTEMRLLVESLPADVKTIAVTGSTGKSTVVTMIGHILEHARSSEAGRVWVGGNLGGSLLQSLNDVTAGDVVVLELSSFMLDWLGDAAWSPNVAAVTNVTPNHLNRYNAFADYVASKQTVFDLQSGDDARAVLTGNAAALLTPRIQHIELINDTDGLPDIPQLPVPGRHNLINAHLAIAACRDLCDADQAAAALSTFTGLPHRTQLVCEYNGVLFYNDSKATTPDATYPALSGFAPGIVHLILGGSDKGVDLNPLVGFAALHCRAIYTVGQTGESIAQVADAGDAEVVRCDTVDAAVEHAVRRVRRGDVVLLSPACASHDQFPHYAARGDAFTAAVLRCTGEGAPLPG